uniref:Sepiapterin reductase n=1 Tax=Takifugu rubripes TaxID=31033 RepID=O42496_TAKRU|nr:sepiapterin reductase [Takifugu rubripes]
MPDASSSHQTSLGRCLCVITGASRGLGRAMAREVCGLMKPGSVLLLVARSETLLQELKEELRGLTGTAQPAVRCVAVDLSAAGGVNEAVEVARQEAGTDPDHVLLINNAGSLGDISKFSSFSDLNEVNSYLSLNVRSALALNAGMLRVFPSRPGLRWSVVNISSLFAVQALPNWALYCTAKADRKMMFSVLADEEPNVKVLSYSPGPMDTEMQKDIQRLTGIKHHLIPCKEPAAKLMKLLLVNEFASGSHLDFFTA